MKPGDIVEAIWDDHCFVFKDYTGEGIMRMHTIGYFVKETETELVLALTLAENKRPNDCQVIDKRLLVSRKKVR